MLTEFLTQSTSLERLRRLADRTLAIKMAEEGADFCELYQFFLTHGHDESGGLRLRAPGLPGRPASKAARRSPRTSVTWTACCG